MSHPIRSFLAVAATFAVVLGLAAAPAPAAPAPLTKCGKLGSSRAPLADRIRARALSCDDAVTLTAKWLETRAGGGPRSVTIDGHRCTSRRLARGVRRVTCDERGGPGLVKFRFFAKRL